MILKRSRRFFQLLEIMIALFLVISCAIPVMGTYVYIYKDQKMMRQTIELDHYVHSVHAKITQDLYLKGASGKIVLTELLDKKLPFEDIEDSMAKLYNFFYELKIERPVRPKTQEKATKFLLNCDIFVERKEGNTSGKDPVFARIYNYKIVVLRDELKEGQVSPAQTPDNNNNTDKAADERKKKRDELNKLREKYRPKRQSPKK